ncbi:RNA-binding protein [Bacteriovoracaceae bacterium]|nr:RNA-binding protein [Bacteriovoracaceae bacterium]
MNSRLYVGNLPFDIINLDSDLEELFAKNGTVKLINIMKDENSGVGRGFAFVEMMNAEEAAMAIQSINQKKFMGRILNVSIASINSQSRFLSK